MLRQTAHYKLGGNWLVVGVVVVVLPGVVVAVFGRCRKRDW